MLGRVVKAPNDRQRKRQGDAVTVKPQFRIVAIYVSVALLWVLFSDRLLFSLNLDERTLSLLHTIKGCLYVLVTGGLLYWLIGRDVRRMDRLNHQLFSGNEQSLRALVSAMDVRHKETRDHSERVMRMTVALARHVGLEGDELFSIVLLAIGSKIIVEFLLVSDVLVSSFVSLGHGLGGRSR